MKSMERILCILVLATVLIGGNAILLRNPIAHRYGGGGAKRPSFGGPVGGYVPSYGPSSGGSPGPYGSSGGSLTYSSSNVVASSTYGGGSYGSSYNAPSGSVNGQVYNPPSSSGYGQPSYNSPSVSYNRPFGLPEGQKFPHGGFTYKFPNDRPPRPPVKSSYISKPYPDFIVRFKSPLYPSQVSLFDKQQVSQAPAPSYPVSGGVPPIYEPGETPMYVAEKVQPLLENPQGVNVGASYQTGGGAPPSPPLFSQDVVLPPSTSIYLLNSNAVAADKLQVDSLESFLSSNGTAGKHSGAQNAYIELSNESVFGSTPEPGVIKPLTPDVVYSPEKNDEFKPMYIFGPMFFPKNNTDLKVDVASENVPSEAKSPSELQPECTEADPSNPKCNLKGGEGTVAPSTKPATNSSAPIADGDNSDSKATTNEDKKPASAASDSKKSTLDDEADDEDDGGGRGLLGVLKGILGVDDSALDEEEEHVSRVDDQKSSPKGSSRPVADEEEEEDLDVEEEEEEEQGRPPKRRRRPASTRRDPNRLRKGSSKSSSSSRFSSSAKKPSSSGGSRGRPAGSRPGTVSLGLDQPPEPLDIESENKPNDRNSGISTGDDSEPTGFVPDQSIEGVPPGQGGLDGEPVVGQVQIGYIGGPPPGSPHNPYQPYFYPAGIPAFDHNPLGPGPDSPMDSSGGDSDHFEADHSREPQGPPIPHRGDMDDHVRRNFHGAHATDNSVHYGGQGEDRDRRPVHEDMRPPFDESQLNGPVTSPGFYDGPNEGFRNPSASFGPQGHRDYEPDTAAQNHPEGHRLDYDSSEKSSVVDSNSVDDEKMHDYTSSQNPESDSHSTTEDESHDVTPSNSDTTYPRTSSYGSSSSDGDTDGTTMTTSYANNGDDRYEGSHVSYDQPTSSQTSSHLHVDEHVSEDPYMMSSESSAFEPLSKNEVPEVDSHDISSTTQDDYQSSSSTSSSSVNADDASTLKSYQTSEDHGETSNDGFALESSSTSEDSHAYSSITRRPFPSFYKYRTSYRPKDRNYVAPTTYRPALRIASTSEKDVLNEEKDVSATIHNSVQDDDFQSQTDIVTISPVVDTVASYNFETANSEPLVDIRESPIVPYGSRIKSDQ